MTSKDFKNNKIIIGTIIFVLGVLAGGAAVHDYDSSNENATAKESAVSGGETIKIVRLHTRLATLAASYVGYIDKAIDVPRSSDSPDVSIRALYDNGESIGKVLRDVYGESASLAFVSAWKVHLDDLMHYASAGSKGDIASKASALADIDSNYTKPLAYLLASINPGLSESALETTLRNHIAMTAKMIDYRNVGDYTNEQTELDAINQHVESLFSTLANAIVLQYPNKFN